MNYLVYMAHGAEYYRQEAVYSLLSWWRARGHTGAGAGMGDCIALVVTDAPESFTRILGLTPAIRYLPVDQARLDAWRGGPGGYVHRIKPQAILYAARTVGAGPGDAVLFVDSDTSFLADPQPLFAAVREGDTFLHEREGSIAGNRRHSRSQGRLYDMARRHAFLQGGQRQLLALDMPLWNSGAVGLRGDRLHLLEETLALTDEIVAALPLATAEQVALSAVLARHGLPVRAAAPWLLHYHVFKEFRRDLAAFFGRHAGSTPAQWVLLSAGMDPLQRIQPKLAFNRLPKWWRQLRKAAGSPWKPLPYPWEH
ncbi:MAG: hypothetical protein V4505_06920 [Pseudomonadota bacterium]